jgi:transcription elongation factor GreA
MNERDAIESEIQKLKYELSVTIPEEIQTAIEQGDLRENSEFSTAITRQHFVGIRLHQLLERLTAYKSVDISLIPLDKVGLGSIVTVMDVHNEEVHVFKLVISEISDIYNDEYTEVTVKSPVGKALHNKSVNDLVSVQLPLHRRMYKITNIITIHNL